MNKKQIEGQLKLSKKQNKDERSDYLCSQFNCVDYLIKLEKYTNNLLRKNKKQKKVIDKIEKYIEKQARMYGLSMPIELGTHLDNILRILKEASK